MLTTFAAPARPDRPTLGRLVSESTVLLMVSIGSIILILALLILFHQNANATKGYMLRTLERERSELLLEEEVLKMQVADAQALGRLESDPKIQTMLTLKNPSYMQLDSTVAAVPAGQSR
ncbi:MAG: hypothetical protein V1926_06390 [Candidatus Peregrinibacteria bacterium]